MKVFVTLVFGLVVLAGSPTWGYNKIYRIPQRAPAKMLLFRPFRVMSQGDDEDEEYDYTHYLYQGTADVSPHVSLYMPSYHSQSRNNYVDEEDYDISRTSSRSHSDEHWTANDPQLSQEEYNSLYGDEQEYSSEDDRPKMARLGGGKRPVGVPGKNHEISPSFFESDEHAGVTNNLRLTRPKGKYSKGNKYINNNNIYGSKDYYEDDQSDGQLQPMYYERKKVHANYNPIKYSKRGRKREKKNKPSSKFSKTLFLRSVRGSRLYPTRERSSKRVRNRRNHLIRRHLLNTPHRYISKSDLFFEPKSTSNTHRRSFSGLDGHTAGNYIEEESLETSTDIKPYFNNKRYQTPNINIRNKGPNTRRQLLRSTLKRKGRRHI